MASANARIFRQLCKDINHSISPCLTVTYASVDLITWRFLRGFITYAGKLTLETLFVTAQGHLKPHASRLCSSVCCVCRRICASVRDLWVRKEGRRHISNGPFLAWSWCTNTLIAFSLAWFGGVLWPCCVFSFHTHHRFCMPVYCRDKLNLEF